MVNDRKLLAREIGKLSLSSGVGARAAAHLLPTETHTETLRIPMPQQQTMDVISAILSKIGSVQPDNHEASHPLVRALVGSGWMNMNPAVMYVEILDATETHSVLTITAMAKEGLIKQKTAKKAAERFLNAIQATF